MGLANEVKELMERHGGKYYQAREPYALDSGGKEILTKLPKASDLKNLLTSKEASIVVNKLRKRK